jgi:SAM-dependent methyltransferase
MDFVHHARERLNPGGVLLISTPNPRHAHQVWSADFTHIRPWPPHDLWALCKLEGFTDVRVYRQVLAPPRRRALWPLQRGLSKLLDLDPAYGLTVVARLPAQAA